MFSSLISSHTYTQTMCVDGRCIKLKDQNGTTFKALFLQYFMFLLVVGSFVSLGFEVLCFVLCVCGFFFPPFLKSHKHKVVSKTQR